MIEHKKHLSRTYLEEYNSGSFDQLRSLLSQDKQVHRIAQTRAPDLCRPVSARSANKSSTLVVFFFRSRYLTCAIKVIVMMVMGKGKYRKRW